MIIALHYRAHKEHRSNNRHTHKRPPIKRHSSSWAATNSQIAQNNSHSRNHIKYPRIIISSTDRCNNNYDRLCHRGSILFTSKNTHLIWVVRWRDRKYGLEKYKRDLNSNYTQLATKRSATHVVRRVLTAATLHLRTAIGLAALCWACEYN